MTPQEAGLVVKQLREARGWSQDRLAEVAGISQTTVDNIEKARTARSKFLPRVAKALEVSLAVIDPDGGEEVALAGPRRQNEAGSILPGADLVGSDRIPVYGAVEGGQGALAISNEPVDAVKRPAPLSTVRGGYGVIITGESMVPAFWPGDIALVNPHMPPRVEDDVILYGEEIDGSVSAIIKNLVRQTPGSWKLRQWNPAKEFEVPKAEWGRCDVVVGKYSRR